jgi:hypothetical protein
LKDYLFERVKRVAKSGDIILLALEYEYYWYDGKVMFQKQTIKEDYILTHDREYYSKLSSLSQLNIMIIGLEDLQRNIRYQSKSPSGYDAKTLNPWGDETNNSAKFRRSPFIPDRSIFPPQFEKDFPDFYGADRIKEFVAWCNEHNVTVLASYPSIVYFKEYDEHNYEKKFKLVQDFYDELGVAQLGRPEDFFYDASLFFDTSYHLTSQGMKQRTEFIIAELNSTIRR